jgi:hypothetical protein
MVKRTWEDDNFLWNLLRVLDRSNNQNNQTAEGIRDAYIIMRPPSWINRKLFPGIRLETIQKGLTILSDEKLHERVLVTKELVRIWNGEELDVDLPVYRISSAGIQALQQRKKKS